ncbi:hypothetical protein ET475_02555 [Microbacterium protaetiae]|uniref:BMP family ABC transporter substrate-binding protein n=2 Tax=Microbacterium protaetiae TaxID=2509458 RepID=A0A4P6EUF4_9MICO|nr:hypothetical protein ET475_02555 [Microbacterium protaetiae]
MSLLAGCLASSVVLTGCADSWDRTREAPAPIGTPGAGFIPTPAPSPEATILPAAGSWAGVHPAVGYRVVLLTAGDDPATRALVAAVQAWAATEHVDLRMVHADDDHVGGITQAMDAGGDLIVVAGNDLIDPLALVSANHLDQTFLVVGAELAEPTENVTAVDWNGASFRGAGLGMSSTYDAASFTPERCAAAIRAGAAAVLSDLTGVVLWID